MRNNKNNPGAVFALALAVFLTGGFLLVVYTGASGRKAGGIPSGFGFRSAPVAAPSYLRDFKKGGEIIKQKADALFDDIFSGGAKPAPPAALTAAAQRRSGPDEDEGGDAFERYYKKHYASNYVEGGGGGARPWADIGGGQASGGGGGGGSSEAEAQVPPGKDPKKGVATAGEPPGAPGQVPKPGAAFGGPTAGDKSPAAAPRYASLPGKRPDAAGLNPGGPHGASPGYGSRQPATGGLSNMPGQGPGISLDGASEKMKTGAQSSYNSKMSGGAAAAAASSGGSSPAASSPGGGTAGGASGAGDAVKPGEKDAKPGDKAGKAGPAPKPERSQRYSPEPPPADDQDLLKSVVADRVNGVEVKYISAEDALGAPEEALLKAGAVAGGEDDKDAADAAGTDAAVADPVNISALPDERRKALKKNIHTFLKRVENKYGNMTEIYRTPCPLTPDLCKEHEVSGSYLTMVTAKGAKLVLGIKYVKTRWRPYTMDFKAPSGVVKPPVPEDVPDDVPEEEPQ